MDFIATNEIWKEMHWLKRLLDEIDFKKDQYLIHCDSESVNHLSKNSSSYSRANNRCEIPLGEVCIGCKVS